MIEGKNIVIRPIIEEDLKFLERWNTPEGRGDYQSYMPESPVSLKREFNENGLITSKLMRLIIETIDGERIGLFYVSFLKGSFIVSLGLEIPETGSRNKGYGSEALELIIKFLFNNYPVHRIQADTEVGNKSAQKVLEKNGFIREGVLREFRYHKGKWNDFAMYSILKSEFNNKD